MNYGFEVDKQLRGGYVHERVRTDPLLPLGEEFKSVWKVVGADWTVSIDQADFPIICSLSKSEAIREMEEFIRQAQEALARLRALE